MMYKVRRMKKENKIGVVVGGAAADAPVPLNIIPNKSTLPLLDWS